MSEFHDVLATGSASGDVRSRLVDRAMLRHNDEVLRQWRAEGAASSVAEVGLVAGSVETVPQIPSPRVEQPVVGESLPISY